MNAYITTKQKIDLLWKLNALFIKDQQQFSEFLCLLKFIYKEQQKHSKEIMKFNG